MEPSITINHQTCTQCGICTEVCPNKILFKDENNHISTRPDRINLCFVCGQCMAVCSTKSVQLNGLKYDKDFFEFSTLDSENTFYQLIATRRAIRNFKDKPVPHELMEKIVEAIQFAPPGFPPLKIKLVVIENSDLIGQALPKMVNLYDGLVRAMKNPFIRFFIKKEVGKPKFRTMQNHLIPLLKSRLPELKQGTEDTITRHAQAMILFLADKNGEDITADIYIAATYGMLATHSLGLGGSIMDLIPPAIDRQPELRKAFQIPENYTIITSMIIGYPKYKYQRGIKREIKQVSWL